MESTQARTGSAPEPSVDPKSAQGRYQTLSSRRQPYLDRARRMALLTIPALFPPDGFGPSSEIEDPYQSIGSRGVNNLSSKLLFALIPPNQNFFRYEASADLRAQLEAQPDLKSKIEEALASYETETLREIERSQLRSSCYEMFKHLCVAGNALIYIPNTGAVRHYPLTAYVVKRDPRGSPVEIYIREQVSPQTLPQDLREFVSTLRSDGQTDPDCPIDIYTGYARRDKHWDLWQEVQGRVIPGSTAKHPLDDPRLFALRFTRIDGEDYGRGYVEELAGDLRVVDALSQAVAEGSLVMSKVLFGIAPNATVTPEDLERKPNGGFFEGRPEEVWALQVQKAADFSVATQKESSLRQELSAAFLLNSAVQRNAERVTAEEIRYVAQELEDALGGVYSLLSEEFQRPLITRMMRRLSNNNPLFQELPKNAVVPVIVTGLDALGRNHDLSNLERAMAVATQLFGPEVAAQYVKPEVAMRLIFVSSGVQPKDLLRSPEELAAMQQQAQQATALQQVIPHAAKAVGDLVKAQATPAAPK
jgi:hypothetical protein